ncbi:MAG: hypothetical protein K2X91_03595 [Thermoleophilia bacterium]|nr:hypothetical protein [Thermoleophilia bacterium]
MPDSSNYTMELLLRQYDTLRREVEGFIHEQGQLATYGVIATGIVWSAVLTQPALRDLLVAHPSLRVLLFIPMVLAVLFYYRNIKLEDHIHVCGDHLARLEAAFGLVGKDWGALAWDASWRRHREEGRAGGLREWHRVYWITLCLLNLVAACVVGWVYQP